MTVLLLSEIATRQECDAELEIYESQYIPHYTQAYKGIPDI